MNVISQILKKASHHLKKNEKVAYILNSEFNGTNYECNTASKSLSMTLLDFFLQSNHFNMDLLCESVVNCATLSAFKKRLIKFDPISHDRLDGQMV